MNDKGTFATEDKIIKKLLKTANVAAEGNITN